MILNSENRENIIKRLDLARRNRRFTFKQVGELFGIGASGANTIFKNFSLSEERVNLLVSTLEINEDWLLSGNGEMFLTEGQVNEKKKQAFALPNNYQTIEEMDSLQKPKNQYEVKGVPYFDVEFKAGFDLLMVDAKTNPEYMIYDPIYAGCDAVIPAFGNSMTPKIFSGDRLGIKVISIEDIFFGEIYALVTKDLRTLKYVRRSKDETKVLLVPENKEDFDEQEISKNKILKVFLVKVITRENC